MNAQTPPPTPSNWLSVASTEQRAVGIELAKCLDLVAPVSMDVEAKVKWLKSSVEALEGIRAAEIVAVSLELRRSVTRHTQIVPEVAKLVSEHRKRPNAAAPTEEERQNAAHARIGRETSERLMRLDATDRAGIEEVARWRRDERRRERIPPEKVEERLSREELDNLPEHIVSLGLTAGLLERRDGKLCEVDLG